MLTFVERAVLYWLRRVVPPDWADNVAGDLQEECEMGTRRLWSTIHMARIAWRFSAEAVRTRWRDRRRRRCDRERRAITFGSDLRQAARGLARDPGFSLVAIVTLAIAIGANTAIYTALSALVLRPLPFEDGHRFVLLWHKGPDMSGVMITPSPPAIEQWRRATHVFERVESYPTESLLLTGTGEPEDISVSFLRSSSLATFGIAPVLGRPFVESDHAASGPPVVLLSDGAWRTRFHADPEIVGRTITLGGTPYTIVGVMPRRFRLPMGSDDVWAAYRPGAVRSTDSENTIGKLAPGVSPEQAQTALDAMPDLDGFKGWRGVIMKPSETHGSAMKTALFVLTGAVGLLLLIACVNVANLLLSRNSGRAREIAVRHALGASRGRLVRYLLAESAMLAGAGGLVGLAVAHGGLEAMAALSPRNLEVLEQLRLEPNALGFAAVVTVLTGVVFGAGPALWASRTHLQHVLRSGGRTATGAGMRIRGVLTVAQVAVALMLLVGASLLIKSYAKLTAIDPGFEPTGVLSVSVSLPAARYPTPEPARRQLFFDSVLASVASIPGVRSAAIGTGVPPETGISVGRLELEGGAESAGDRGIYSGGYITPAYFSTLGIPVVEGRAFTREDRVDSTPVAIVNRTFAQRYFPARTALGGRLRTSTSGPWVTIVGVVGDVKALGLTSSTGDVQIYRPRAQTRPSFGAIVVKTDGDPRALVGAIKQRIWEQDPQLPIREVATADQLLSRSIAQWRFNLALLGVLACCGLALAVVGVYGVTALLVNQRQREVGIRMALGATRVAVARLVMGQTAALIAAALAIGLGGALLLGGYLASLVYQTPTNDAASFAAAAAGIAGAAFVATIIPLRRATSVDPAVVLRAD